MKSINFINKQIFSKGFLVPLCTGAAFLFLTVNTSCNKESLDTKGKPFLTTRDAKTTLMNIVPNDGNDDTDDIQAAIDQAASQGGGTVSLPDGDYNVKVDTTLCIHLKSNVTLAMTPNARLIATPTTKGHYSVIRIANIHDARVLGGKIIGDRDNHLGSGGEWGYGINITGSDHIRIVNTRIGKCWGDGIGVAGPSTNITIKGVWSRNNRRQAISVFEVDGLLIDSCYLYNTDGTAPADGIDIEPDAHTTRRTAQNITISNCKIYSNGFAGNQYGNNGIELNGTNGDIKYVTIDHNEIYDNLAYSGYFANADHVTFTNNTMHGNGHDGVEHGSVTNYVHSGNQITTP